MRTTTRQLLGDAHTVAVVGASRDPLQAAHWVPKMLQEHGWQVIPVNPHAHRLFGVPAYARLADIPVHVDIVDVFRPAEEAPELVREATAIGAGAVWLQLGIASEEGRRLALEAGLDYVENTCIGTERAVAQMVVGGAMPHPKVYRGLVPRADRVTDGRRAPADRVPAAVTR
jgi:predicted CoA-binding protein